MQPGARIGGWEVLERLGGGGAAEVYRCRRDGREAAIKLLRSGRVEDEQATRRLAREAEILMGLQHPNIVRVRHVALDADPPWLEMDLVSGRHAGWLVKAGPSALRTACRLTGQLLSAMACWHDRQIAHRDLKPANLLVGHDLKLVVVDFGLALDESLERLSAQGVRLGTCAYAPPEWVGSDGPPAAWDVYAAGQVLQELLTGRRAFDAKLKPFELMRQKAALPHLDPGPRTPEPLRALVADLTRREPADRLPDGAAALGRFVQAADQLGLPVS